MSEFAAFVASDAVRPAHRSVVEIPISAMIRRPFGHIQFGEEIATAISTATTVVVTRVTTDAAVVVVAIAAVVALFHRLQVRLLLLLLLLISSVHLAGKA